MASEEGGEKQKKDPRSVLSSALKEIGHPLSLAPAVQNELEQVVESILQIDDKEEQSEIIVNVLQFIISYNQTEQLSSYPFTSPELLERYKKVDEGVFKKIIELTEKTVEQDLTLEVQEAKIKLQQAESQLDINKIRLLAEIEIDKSQIEIDKQRSAAEIEILRRKLEHDIKSRSRGQYFAFTFAILSLLVGVFAIYQGSPIGGSILSVLGVATTIITSFLKPSDLHLPITIKGKKDKEPKPTSQT